MAKKLPIICAGIACTNEALRLVADVPIEGWVWPQSARRQEVAGKLRRIADDDGNIIAWQRLSTIALLREEVKPPARKDVPPVMTNSNCSIAPHEMTAYAGRHFKGGGSRTVGLSDEQREARKFSDRPLSEAEITAGRRQQFGKPPAEDFIERVVAKVNLFGQRRAIAS